MKLHGRKQAMTHGVDTHGAAAEVLNFDVLGKKVRPGTFGKIKVD